jgi:hypothetical protein
MFFFLFLTYTSLYVGLAFVALCLATGLYYLAELAEEYTITTKKVINSIVISISIIHVLLLIFERFPFWITLFGLFTHLVYYQFLKEFPFFQILSFTFFLSCACFLFSHVFWYWHFTDHLSHSFDFYQLLGFFFSCVWITPLLFFVTLSVNDNSLPGAQLISEYGIPKKKRNSLISYILSFFKTKKNDKFYKVQKEF